MQVALLLILSFFSALLPVPNLENGRVKPTNAPPYRIPLKNGQWETLEKAKENSGNPSLYSDAHYDAILRSKNEEELISALYEAYSSIAGTPIKKGEVNTLLFPTLNQLKAEEVYHKIPFVWIASLLYLAASLLIPRFTLFGSALFVLAFLIHSLFLGLRIFILARPPVSNIAETLFFAASMVVLTGALFFYFYRKKTFLWASALTSGILLIMVPIFKVDASLDPLQPVLNSKFWLSTHVLMVVSSFGVFAFSALLSHIFLWTKNPKMEKPILQSIYIGTALLITGTILGGIWASQSWGRFWDWDPKESWAFISAGAYVLTIHAYRYKKIGLLGLSMGSIVGFMLISFTWYGVNYILGTGLHSYGFGSGGVAWYLVFISFEIVFIIYAFLRITFLAKK